MIKPGTYTKKVLALIIFFSILRLIVATSVGLGNDESYYWFFSQSLKWNYFDHPPMVALWIRIFTANLLLEKYVLFLRLGAIVGSAVSTWFIFKCVTTISTERAGWFAALFYNASFYAGITAGLFIMPDSPQMVFYTFSLWMIARITKKEENWMNWILFGIGAGLCIMSKVHGAFIWIGLGAYILFLRRKWLLNSRLYIALIISLLIACPILIWNFQHDFATYRFNSERVVVQGFSLNWSNFFTGFIAQVMINNPFNVIFILMALFSWRKHKMYAVPALTIFNFIAIPFALLLLYISLYRLTLPHWSGPAYVTLIPLAAIRLADISKKYLYPKIILASVGSYLIFMIVSPLVINYFPGHFGKSIQSQEGKGDLTLDMYGWKQAAKKFDSVYKKEVSSGAMPMNSPVVCNTWWGSHIEYYFCRPLNIQMIGLGELNKIHEYMWMNNFRKDKVNFSSAYCIVNSDDFYNVKTAYSPYYNQIDTVIIIPILRGNKPAHNFSVFRLAGWKNNLPFAEK